MKLLVVTDRIVCPLGAALMCSQDFYLCIQRFLRLGEVYICCQKKEKDTNLISNNNLCELTKRENIFFIQKSSIIPDQKNKTAICNVIRLVDLVVGYVPSVNAEFAEFYAKQMGKKYLAFMVACPWDGLWNQDIKRKMIAPYRFLLCRKVLSCADYALYVTNRFLQKRYPTKSKINAGISDVAIRDVDLQNLGIRLRKIDEISKGNVIKLATTATLDIPYKGQRFVISAIKELKKLGYDNYHYYMIGGGNSGKLRQLAERLGIKDQIHFVGKLTHGEVFEFLKQMDIYIHPSLQEGLPRSMVEAMSVGLPCIGSDTAAIPELLDSEYIVRRRSVKDIVRKVLLLQDKERMKAQSLLNFEEAKKYSNNVLDARRDNFYKEVLDDLRVI